MIPFSNQLCNDSEMKLSFINLRFPIFELIYFFVCLILSIYFLLATFKGEYGLFKKYQLLATENVLKVELINQTKTKQILQNRVNRLSISSLDLELLDEQDRCPLNVDKKAPTIATVIHPLLIR